MRNLKKIILIDDHGSTNFYHQYILNQSGRVEEVLTGDSVEEGTGLLEELDQVKESLEPSIVFLDVNLPKYTGFELINRNKDLVKRLISKGVLFYMLSSSQNPSDLELVANTPLIEGFYEKPLTMDVLDEIVRSKISLKNS